MELCWNYVHLLGCLTLHLLKRKRNADTEKLLKLPKISLWHFSMRRNVSMCYLRPIHFYKKMLHLARNLPSQWHKSKKEYEIMALEATDIFLK